MKHWRMMAGLVCVLSLFLVGCGGGGGGSSNPLAETSQISGNAAETIRGKVQGEGDLSGIPVFLVPADSQEPFSSPLVSLRAGEASSPFTTKTEASGTFVFQKVPAGKYNLIAQKNTSLAGIVQDVSVHAAITEVPVITLTPTGNVGGTVTVPSGSSSTGVILFLQGTSFSAFTDNNGSYRISGVPVGTYKLMASSMGFKAPAPLSVSVVAGTAIAASGITLVKDEVFFSAIVGVTWKGSLAAAPANPGLNWGYYDTTDKKSYLWNGTTWTILAQDGTPGQTGPAGATGTTGLTGATGTAGISVAWQGSLASAPASPLINWAYYNTTDKKAYLFDGTNWQSMGSDGLPFDAVPPVISGMAVRFVGSTTAQITWDTNEQSTSLVNFGTTSSFGQSVSNGAFYSIEHIVTLVNLTPGTTYYYQVVSSDIPQNQASTTAVTFIQNSSPVQPSITSPAAGQTGLSLNPTVTASAFSDAAGDTHKKTELLVYQSNGVVAANLVWQSPTAAGSFTSIVINNKNGAFVGDLAGQERLYSNSVYTVVARYTDNWGAVSDWSPAVSFTTRAPATVEWSKIYGGTGADFPYRLKATPDGGFIISGVSDVVDGDLEGNDPAQLGWNGWILKTSGTGVLEWQKNFGANGNDQLLDILPTPEGGYVIAGYSDYDGAPAPGFGGAEGYVFKLNSSGGKMWEKFFGGSLQDGLKQVIITSDGGYVVVGDSNSSDGYLGAAGAHGGYDAWVTKFNPSGNIEWTYLYGGTGDDFGKTVIETPDGGFLFTASTESIDGDLSTTTPLGGTDTWVAKLTSTGALSWSKRYGGSGSDIPYGNFIETSDGGYMIFGETDSSEVPGKNAGASNLWFLKIDANADMQWQRAYGSTGTDYAGEVRQIDGGGFVAAGTVGTNGGNVTGSHGSDDAWLFGTDPSGNLLWQRCFGGTDRDNGCSMVIRDGNYFLTSDASSADGDLPTFHRGNSDVWLFKVTP